MGHAQDNRKLPGYWEGLALAFDHFANAAFRGVWNLFVKDDGARFGFPDEDMSSVMGKNFGRGTCPVCDWMCKHVLSRFGDHYHCRNAIEHDEGDKL